jgi:EmrB/QacA subfamily drug resistance transporter
MKARLLSVALAPQNRKWWTLLAVSFGLFMIMLDNTVVNVALPSIQKGLHANQRELEWVVVGYTLTFATFMLTGGKLADLLGRRRLFTIGLIVFTAASLACGLAPSAGFLISMRALQGIGAAIMNPATLSIIVATFPPRQRSTAIGIWAGTSAMALAIGPLLGGLLAQYAHWSWIFFINVPVGVLGVLVARWAIDETRDTSREQRLDLPGLVASGGGLFALSYALIEANNYGWASARILGLFGVAVVALVGFVLLELRQRIPMLDLSLFRSASYAGANLVVMFVALAMFGIFFFNSLFFQHVLGYSPTQTGAIFLPMTLLIITGAPWAGRLVDRVGARWLIGAGMSLIAVSLVLFAQLGRGSNFLDALPALLTGGLGMAITMTPSTAAAMAAVPVDKAGVGSAVLNAFRQVGGTLGVAVMGAIVGSQIHVSTRNPAYLDQFVKGYHLGLYVAAGIALSGAAVAVATVRKMRHAGVAEAPGVA